MNNIRNITGIFIVTCAMLGFNCFADEPMRDPFESNLPVEKKSEVISDESIVAPEVTIQGVLWGTERAAAIIDGEVYSVGDTLKSVDAQVCRIEKDTVFINYKGKIFEIGSPKKKEAQ